MQENTQQQRHELLPPIDRIPDTELPSWLSKAAKVIFTDEKRRYFTQEEIKDFEHESSANGRHMNKLNDLLKTVRELVTKGNPDGDQHFTVPETPGTKNLEAFRRQNDDFVERGYEVEPIQIFGIPSDKTYTMEFFDASGEHIAERSRALSHKDRLDFFGIFDNGIGAKLSIDTRMLGNTAEG